jgi:hypothetical protein
LSKAPAAQGKPRKAAKNAQELAMSGKPCALSDRQGDWLANQAQHFDERVDGELGGLLVDHV